MKGRLGCAPGTTAVKKWKESWGEFDRCPLAIMRELPAGEIAMIHWAISLAVAKRQGSLAAYVAPDTLSAAGEELIETAENVMAAREAEALERASDGGR